MVTLRVCDCHPLLPWYLTETEIHEGSGFIHLRAPGLSPVADTGRVQQYELKSNGLTFV